jgi:hypothetical protein
MLPPLNVATAVERQVAAEVGAQPAQELSGTFPVLMDVKTGRVLAHYPAGHQLGMRVPQGGSSCLKCTYLMEVPTGKGCSNAAFVAWNGSATLPAPADQYCCDLFAVPDRA